MGRVQLACSGRPEPFPWVMVVPNVQVTHLRSFGGGQTDNQLSRDLDGITTAWLTQMRLHQCLWSVADLGVEIGVSIDGRAFLGKVRWTRLSGAVGGFLRLLAAEGEVRHLLRRGDVLHWFSGSREWEKPRLFVQIIIVKHRKCGYLQEGGLDKRGLLSWIIV